MSEIKFFKCGDAISEAAHGLLRILRKRDARIISVSQPRECIEKVLLRVRREALEEAIKIVDRYRDDRYTSDTAIEAENMGNEIRSLMKEEK